MRRISARLGVWLAGLLAVPALTCATAVAAASRAVDCPTPQVPTLGCPAPGGGGGGGGGTSGGSGGGSGVSGGSAGSSAQSPGQALPADQVLSNEIDFTQFAYVKRIANIYLLPSTHSRQISKLSWFTEDGFDSTYILLRSHWRTSRQEWVKIRIPGRPNGRTGWVQRGALGRFHVTHDAVVVNRGRMRMYYLRNGHQIWNAPVGVGAPSMPTPTGHFWINERFVITDPSNGYYPYAFGTTDYSTLTDWPGGGVVGIHGPFGAPASAIPGRISHGCIRLRIRDDFWLGQHMQMGTPVRVV